MQFIDKTIKENEGKSFVNALLKEAWNKDDKQYYGANYEGLKTIDKELQYEFTKLLLNIQGHKCCYCMKELTPETTTLEHVIPQKAPSADWEKYFQTTILAENVVLMDGFDRQIRIIPPPKYPHDIAFHNLLASCKSGSHCNNYRGNKYIEPITFDRKIGERANYDVGGRASLNSSENDEINRLGLNTFELTSIRLIFLHLIKNDFTLESLDDDALNEIILDLAIINNTIRWLEDYSGNGSQIQKIKAYGWFFNYYKDHNQH